MRTDAQGLPLTIASDEAATAFADAVEGFVKYRADTMARLERALAADPGCALAHCLKGYLVMLSSNRANVPVAAAALAAGEAARAGATARERRHLVALGAWAGGFVDRALEAWEDILAAHPTDLLALRLAHFNYFWLGRMADMRTSIERAATGWSESLPGFGTVLAMRAFGAEECGDYPDAERFGRRAIALDAGDLWAAHAVAHALEMQNRAADGIAWLEAAAPRWDGANNMIHHLWWHRALFHLERGETDQVLALYDTRIRNLDSPLVRAMPDLYIPTGPSRASATTPCSSPCRIS
jgi:tetratricopeptide (TPR) repeat protein